MKFCHSCSMPLEDARMRSKTKDLCVHCTDASGKLLPREQAQAGIAHWLTSWQGDLSEKEALARAGHFMKAMPMWAGNGGAKSKPAARKAAAKKLAAKKTAKKR